MAFLMRIKERFFLKKACMCTTILAYTSVLAVFRMSWHKYRAYTPTQKTAFFLSMDDVPFPFTGTACGCAYQANQEALHSQASRAFPFHPHPRHHNHCNSSTTLPFNSPLSISPNTLVNSSILAVRKCVLMMPLAA